MIKRMINNDVPVDRLRLQASERNLNWPEELLNEFKNSISQSDIKFYPNLNTLYSKVSKHFNFDQVVLGSGSDKCIEYFIQSHRDRYKKLVIFDPCFPMYFVYGEVYGMEVVKVKQNSLNIPYETFLNTIDSDCIVIITNPTSPLGEKVSHKFIKELLDLNVPTLVDEAYIEFSSCNSADKYLRSHPNLFITRTFSKALGSAGIRLGVITSSNNNLQLIQQFRPMYEINTLTAKWAEIVIDNYSYTEQYINKVVETRNRVIEVCKLKNIPYINGESNWIHIIKEDLPQDIIIKKNCKVPGSKENWVRLQITSDINDYKWL